MVKSKESVYRVFYTSKAAPELDSSDLNDIIRTAQEKNDPLGITGMLLFIGNYFCQVIEGSKDDVDALFMKIIGDQRHSDVKMIFAQAGHERLFPKWSMGLKVFTDQDMEDLKQLNRNAEFDLKQELNERKHFIIDMMKHFYKYEELNFKHFWSKPNEQIDL